MPATLTLNGVALPHGMVWTDRYESQQIAQSVERTLGGRAIAEYQPLIAGANITLESLPDQGWLTYSQVQQIQALAATPGGIFALQIDSLTFSVLFRHHEPPAFDAEPFVKRLNPGSQERYTATIKLITV